MEGRNGSGFVALIVMRIIYAINWLNIGSIFQQIALDFKSDVSALGSLTSSFYLGIGIFQVPGGIFAARYGAKKAIVIGNFISSLAALLCSFAEGISELLVLRFVVGAGMAFVFSPGVAIVASYFSREKKGYSVGLYNSAYDIGGVFALFLWGLIAAHLGWRISLDISGGLGIGATVAGVLLIREEKKTQRRVDFGEIKKIFLDRELFYLSIGVLSVGTGNALLSSFLIYNLEATYGYSEAIAGLIGSLIVVLPIFSSPLSGRLYDRTRNARILTFFSGLIMSVAVGVVPVLDGISSAVATILGGVAVGFGITVGFAAAREISKASREYEPLAVGWVNFISLFGVFVPPLIFSQIANSYGYGSAWLFGALITLLLSVPVLKMNS